jgi:hypothetical protein
MLGGQSMQEAFAIIEKNSGWLIMAVVAVVWIVAATVQQIILGKAREQSRREIAAYIAEGSMSAEQGERLLRAKSSENDE